MNAVDTFVFADDVHFIKGGFINRNKMLFESEERYFSVPCQNKSQNKLINEVGISEETKGYPDGILRTFQHAYARAPYFKNVFPILELVFHSNVDSIAKLAVTSIEMVSKYLEIKVDFRLSSESFGHTRSQERSLRLINITKELGGDTYVNPIGGAQIYDKPFFASHGITLSFLEFVPFPYAQFNDTFVPNLSIIDVLMFNSIDAVHELLNTTRLT